MAQVYKKLVIDVNKSNPGIIAEAVQNDANSRFLDIVLVDGSTPIDLTGHEVRVYGKKYDGTEFYNDGEITESTAGRCQFEMTSQALAAAGDLKVQIIIFKDNVEVLSTQEFTIHVVRSLMSNSSIESSNEYGALVVLYQNLYEAYDLMTEMVQKIGVPGEQAQLLNLDTMFEVWDWMVEYLQANSTAGIVETVNTILNRIGTHDSTSDTDVLGKLNDIQMSNKIYVPSDTEREILLSTPVTAPAQDNHRLIVQRFTPKRNGVIKIKAAFEKGDGGKNVLFYIYIYGESRGLPNSQLMEVLSVPNGTTLVGAVTLNGHTYMQNRVGGLSEVSLNMPVFAGWPIVFFMLGTATEAQRATVHSIKICYDEEVV